MNTSDEPDENFIDWEAQRQAHRERCAANREAGAKALTDAGITYVTHNAGVHLIVDHGRYDYWPGTGLWKVRGQPQKHRGVKHLIKHIRNQGHP